MKSKLLASVAIFVAALVATQPDSVLAEPILDQSYTDERDLPIDVSSGESTNPLLGQLFTAGLTGNLMGVDLRAWIDYTRGTNTGVPVIRIAGPLTDTSQDGPTLASLSVPLAAFPDFHLDDYVKVDFSGFHAAVTAGQIYRIEFLAPFDNVYWGVGPGSTTGWPYAGGIPQWINSTGGYHWAVALPPNGGELYALNFRTFVDVAVPEPSSLVLAAFGVAGLLAYGWRRRSER